MKTNRWFVVILLFSSCSLHRTQSYVSPPSEVQRTVVQLSPSDVPGAQAASGEEVSQLLSTDATADVSASAEIYSYQGESGKTASLTLLPKMSRQTQRYSEEVSAPPALQDVILSRKLSYKTYKRFLAEKLIPGACTVIGFLQKAFSGDKERVIQPSALLENDTVALVLLALSIVVAILLALLFRCFFNPGCGFH